MNTFLISLYATKQEPRLGVDGKYHFVYITENIDTGYFYIGKHSTADLDDGYIGSGEKLLAAVKLNGLDKFKTTPIYFFDDVKTCLAKESYLICRVVYSKLSSVSYNKPSAGVGVNNGRTRQQLSDMMKAKWQDPAYRAKKAKKV